MTFIPLEIDRALEELQRLGRTYKSHTTSDWVVAVTERAAEIGLTVRVYPADANRVELWREDVFDQAPIHALYGRVWKRVHTTNEVGVMFGTLPDLTEDEIRGITRLADESGFVLAVNGKEFSMTPKALLREPTRTFDSELETLLTTGEVYLWFNDENAHLLRRAAREAGFTARIHLDADLGYTVYIQDARET